MSMCNIDNAIKKLDEQIDISDSAGTHSELREILKAMKSGDQKQFEHKYESLVHEIRMTNKRIGAIESKCGCKVKWKDEVNQRLDLFEYSLKRGIESTAKQIDKVRLECLADNGDEDPFETIKEHYCGCGEIRLTCERCGKIESCKCGDVKVEGVCPEAKAERSKDKDLCRVCGEWIDCCYCDKPTIRLRVPDVKTEECKHEFWTDICSKCGDRLKPSSPKPDKNSLVRGDTSGYENEAREDKNVYSDTSLEDKVSEIMAKGNLCPRLHIVREVIDAVRQSSPDTITIDRKVASRYLNLIFAGQVKLAQQEIGIELRKALGEMI